MTQGDVTAVVEDGVSFGGSGIKSLTIQSRYSSTERVHAAAGAESGTAIVPVLAVGVSGVYVEATLGVGSALTAAEDALISSVGSIDRYYEADAAAIGNGVGIGGAFCIGGVDD